ncbi:Hypothetical Protein FCC1311_053472 [Hondaea fermentalgiana]|uniref:Uncharacterized protein n=1 Tax=Hondaea fermentalgiana TaxID=2315210 RepID=A0A2R5GMM7_9STRA|nr:Hypothetical Protein FCC1311_053472 [Hondaea fermentalgiana]|eukprot:GBG29124.1 Hypothetical Protein FCC1311_053472 [Hondaea fermentalgiana]
MAPKTQAKQEEVDVTNLTKPVIADENMGFWEAVAQQKEVDHHASHSNLINQWLHLISSTIFIICYYVVFMPNQFSWNEALETAMYWGLFSLIIRQAGHYIFEPPCHDKEQAMLGFDTENKVRICVVYGGIPAALLAAVHLKGDINISLAQAWIVVTFSVVFGRVALLWSRYGFRISMHWFVKFVTDPFTDIPAYWKSGYQIFMPKLVQGALHSSFPNTFSMPAGYVAPKSGYDKDK